MRSLLVILSIAATACTLFGASPLDEKAKAKAKAKAAMNIEAERERDAKSVRATIPAKPFTDLDKAKTAAIESGKLLVLWVGEPAEDAVKEVDAVHVTVKEFSPSPDAKCVVFSCESGKCERKSSITSRPSVSILKSMIEDVMKTTTKKIAEPEFFIGTSGEAVPVEPSEAPAIVQYRQVCTIDEFGRKTCRWVPVESPGTVQAVPIEIKKSAPVASYASGDCPCVAAGGSCPCGASGSASGSAPVLSRFREWFQNRPRLFNGRFAAAFAALRGR